MSVSYNKLSSIQIGGTYVNYVPIGARGNVSLDCSGNSLFRGATFMDASLNVSGIFNVGGDVSMNSKLFVGGDVSMNSKLRVSGDVSMNSNLFVGGDVSFNQNLYTIGNTSTKSLTINDAYPTPIKTAQIGFDIVKPITTMLTTGTTSNVASGTAFKPISIVIPAGNASNVVYVEVPINLTAFWEHKQIPGTITITYTSVSMNIYRNGSLQSATGQSIASAQFTGGDTKTATNTGGTAPFNFPSYLSYYFGYFNIQFPLVQFNTAPDTYEVELIITGSATHTSGSQPMFLSIASTAGEMGYNILSPRATFTETRDKSSTYPTQITYVSAATTPFNPVDVQVQYDYGLKMISDTDFLISAIGQMNLKTNQEFNISSVIGSSTMTSDGGSIEINAPNGFWTATTSENMYLKTTGTNSQILFGNATTDWVGLDTDATSFSIRTYDKAFYTNCGDVIETLTGNFTQDVSGSMDITTNYGNMNYYMPTAGLFSIYNNNTLMFRVQNAQVSVTNADFSVTGTGTGSFPTLQVTGSADLQCNITAYQDSYASMANTRLGYTNSATTTTDPMNNTVTSRSSFSLPNRGVWLIICGYEWYTNTSNTVRGKLLVLSTTSGGTTPAAYGLQYYEEINDAAGAAEIRQEGTLTGVYTATAATTIHVNARSEVDSGTNTKLVTNVSWTRIG